MGRTGKRFVGLVSNFSFIEWTGGEPGRITFPRLRVSPLPCSETESWRGQHPGTWCPGVPPAMISIVQIRQSKKRDQSFRCRAALWVPSAFHILAGRVNVRNSFLTLIFGGPRVSPLTLRQKLKAGEDSIRALGGGQVGARESPSVIYTGNEQSAKLAGQSFRCSAALWFPSSFHNSLGRVAQWVRCRAILILLIVPTEGQNNRK